VFPSSRGAHTAESDTFEVLELYGTTGKCVVLMAIDGKGKFIHILFGTNIISVWNQHLRGVLLFTFLNITIFLKNKSLGLFDGSRFFVEFPDDWYKNLAYNAIFDIGRLTKVEGACLTLRWA
jgi:hypothetical protein